MSHNSLTVFGIIFVCLMSLSRIMSAFMLYYCDMVRWAWWDWELSGWLTTSFSALTLLLRCKESWQCCTYCLVTCLLFWCSQTTYSVKNIHSCFTSAVQ